MRRRTYLRSVDGQAVKKRSGRKLRIETLEPRHVLSANLLITEFVASNGSTLADGDGEYSDWIEIYNPTQQSVDLAGWHLTDDAQNLDKWTFPALPQSILEPGGYLVVFASAKTTESYVDPAGFLHTDFALSSDGEYLALTDASGTIVHHYAPQFPAQVRDVSYGVLENSTVITLIGDTHSAKGLVPTSGALDSPSPGVSPPWTLPQFDDSSWPGSTGGPGVGFDFGDDSVPNIPNGTLLPEGLIGADFTDPNEDGVLNGAIFAGGFPGSPAGEEPPKGLDNTVTTKWLAFEPGGTYYGFRFAGGQRHAVDAYTLTSANDEPNRDPYSWTLSGSNDGVNYTVVDTRTAQDFAGRFETRLYEFSNSTPYEYYRFDFLTEYGATGQNQPVAIQVAEFELLSTSPADYSPLIDLDVEAAWKSATSSVYQRIEFEVTDPSELATLLLEMQYDDGFVAYLNGTQVAASHAPSAPNYQSSATGERDDAEAFVFQSFNLTPFLGELVSGTNVLAIHVLNTSDASPDLLSRPRLTATSLVDNTLTEVFMPQATPGAANSEGYFGIVAAPEFSAERGFYDSPFQLTVTTDTPDAQVYYTTDGTEPTPSNGTLYTAPINVSGTSTLRAQAYLDGFLASSPVTHTYLFVNDIVRQNHQATLNRGLPPSWGGVSPDYGMDPDVIGRFDAAGNWLGGDLFGGTYAATIKSDLLAIPTLSIVMDADDLFGSNGIYTHSTASGVAWERATSVELIHPDGEPGFQIDAGIRMHGGAFRSHGLSKKHSMRLLFKGIYEGNTKLDYPWFGEDAATSFDTIVLRMDSNDGYAWDATGTKAQYARDEFGRRSQAALGQPASHGSRVHLYINGVYWGIYNPVERPDASFAATYYGGDKEDWDAINSGSATDGTLTAWNTLNSLARAISQSPTDAARTAAYMRVLGLNADGTDNPAYETYLNAANYIDFLIVNFYGGNSDWPHRNWYAARQRGPDSEGFVFHVWDYEWTLGLQSNVNTNRIGVGEGAAEPYVHLRSSQEFRLLFADRVHRALFNDGPLTPERSLARYQEIVDELPEAIVAESARWGDMHRSLPYTRADWQNEISNVTNFLTNRTNIFIQQLRNAGLYPSLNAPSFSQYGGQVPPGFELTMSAPSGTIWYTLDGSDPRVVGGGLSPSAIQYTGPISLDLASQVRARVRNGNEWSAIVESTFEVPSALRISEIHYNPAPFGSLTDRQDLEFIEIVNTGTSAASLDGVQIAGFADEPYVFADGLSLEAGERIVVARNPALFQSAYGGVINVAPEGYGDRNLSNGGEQVVLLGPLGEVLQDFLYSDVAPWPTTPDGLGPSLELIDPTADPTNPLNWRASLTFGGSPGTAGGVVLPGDFDRSGTVDDADYLAWKADFGRVVVQGTGADANADGIIDAADFTLWRDHRAPGAASSVLVTADSQQPASAPLPLLQPVIGESWDAAPLGELTLGPTENRRQQITAPRLPWKYADRAIENLVQLRATTTVDHHLEDTFTAGESFEEWLEEQSSAGGDPEAAEAQLLERAVFARDSALGAWQAGHWQKL